MECTYDPTRSNKGPLDISRHLLDSSSLYSVCSTYENAQKHSLWKPLKKVSF